VDSTWMPYSAHGKSTSRAKLPDSVFAFPKQRKEPLTDAAHVRNALARFDQVENVSKRDCDEAVANIIKAAKHFDVTIGDEEHQKLMKRRHTGGPGHEDAQA
jgi:hypothetical protein